MRTLVIAFVLSLAATALAADRPAWIDKPQQPGKLCVSGRSRTASEDPGAAVGRATMRARSEMMRMFGTKVKTVVTKAYVDVKDHLTGKIKKQEYVRRVTSTITDGVLVGTGVEETWVDPESGVGYALVCMGIDDVRETIKRNMTRGFNKNGTFKKASAEKVLKKLTAAVDAEVK